MRIFLLDMGSKKYGDCILVQDGDRTILIDGGHIGDERDSEAARSIPAQLGAIFNSDPPYEVDLLVVTHCHGDHIGCLPHLIANRIVVPAQALVAHPDLGYPPTDNGGDSADPVVEQVVAALREEPPVKFASDAELERFLSDALNLEQRYRQMVESLEARGIPVIRFAGTDDPNSQMAQLALITDFRDMGLQILGPTQPHLLRCTDAIEGFTRDARRAATHARRQDAAMGASELYKLLSGPPRDGLADDIAAFLDRPGKGAALNDQSIVIKVGTPDAAALLTGDMQLAEPEVSGLDAPMSALLDVIRDAGPYAFVKLAHHASYNGFDRRVAEALGGTRVFGVSTGSGDPAHPDESVLELLRDIRSDIRFVRTDRNGGVTIAFENGGIDVDIARGRLDDYSPNRDGPEPITTIPAAVEPPQEPPPPAVRIERTYSDRDVEVTARIPHVDTKVTITIEIAPAAAPYVPNVATPPNNYRDPPPKPDQAPVLGGGRPLPRLLFVTCQPRLERNIGQAEARLVAQCIQQAGQRLLDVADPEDPFPSITQALRSGAYEGVVIVGGYDVLRPLRYDTLPRSLRDRVGANGDPDDFIVWSDQAYGDANGDMLGELPVSRIPDGRSAELVFAALRATDGNAGAERFALRNSMRPFADEVATLVPGREPMLQSAPTRSMGYASTSVDAKSVYLMLHGDHADTSMFWGEGGGGTLDALGVGDLPGAFSGTVFTGCCWGALAAGKRASQYRNGDPIPSLVPEQSVALSFLQRGARAFIGCTGAHYSPLIPDARGDLKHFGAPMHLAFWQRIGQRQSPAQALFGAKMDYIKDMPHGRRDAEDQAIEYKILRQFTCLGLGW